MRASTRQSDGRASISAAPTARATSTPVPSAAVNAWGFGAYTRDVGHVFTPVVTLILCLKAFFFSLVVAILPIAPNPRYDGAPLRRRDEISQLGRLFALILLIEVFSLVGNYY